MLILRGQEQVIKMSHPENTLKQIIERQDEKIERIITMQKRLVVYLSREKDLIEENIAKFMLEELNDIK